MMRLTVVLLAMLSLGTTGVAQSQTGAFPDPGQDGGRPEMAMGGGRMVRGTVTSIDGGKLALKTEQGETYQVALSPNTRMVKGRDPMKLVDIHVGDGIGAMGELDLPNKTVHALFVSVVDAGQIRKMRESLGKTWIAGRITAIDELKITVLRSDKVSQVIAVDEDTSFKRGGRGMQQMLRGDGVVAMPPAGARGGSPMAGPSSGESITLADVKIGDQVGGQGALKNGVFVPTELVVADPNARRQRQGDHPALEPK